MAETESYDVLVDQRTQKETEKVRRESSVRSINAKLERLNRVKEVLTAQKKAFKRIKKSAHDIAVEDYGWSGSNFDEFIEKCGALDDENTSFLNRQLDRLLDELNNVITELENERLEQIGIIGKLISDINSLANRIENFLN